MATDFGDDDHTPLHIDVQGYWALLLAHLQVKRENIQAHMHHELLAIEHGYTSKLQVQT